MSVLSLSVLVASFVAVAYGSHLDLDDHHLKPHHFEHHGPGYGKKIDWCRNGKRYAADPKDCSRYIQIFGGTMMSLPCAPGTHWNQAACTCVHGDCKKPNRVIRPKFRKHFYSKPRHVEHVEHAEHPLPELHHDILKHLEPLPVHKPMGHHGSNWGHKK